MRTETDVEAANTFAVFATSLTSIFVDAVRSNAPTVAYFQNALAMEELARPMAPRSLTSSYQAKTPFSVAKEQQDTLVL